MPQEIVKYIDEKLGILNQLGIHNVDSDIFEEAIMKNPHTNIDRLMTRVDNIAREIILK